MADESKAVVSTLTDLVTVIDFAVLPTSALLVDVRNARLRDPQPSQQAAILALARQQGPKLLELARSIAEGGRLDPLSPLAVVRTENNPNEYIVLEGNRRLVTLKGLETPSLISAAFDGKGQRELQKLSQRYAANPIGAVRCAIFDTEDEAVEWIFMRHDGQSGGKGLVQWGADEKDRFRARHGVQLRSPAGQIIDFVESQGLLSDIAKASNIGIISNLQRMLSSRAIRDVLGIDVVGGKVVMHYPREEVAKSLTRVVEELKREITNVGHIYNKDHREQYAAGFEPTARPDPTLRLPAPVPLGADTAVKGAKPKPAKPGKPPRPPAPREALIPADCQLKIGVTRINLIYHELLRLSVADFANACSVLLRVFVELSVDEYINTNAVQLKAKKPSDINLAFKIKATAAHLLAAGKIDKGLVTAMNKVADGSRVLAASTVTFNQYVHSPWVHPQPIDLRSAWDELQPFMEALWP